MVAALLELNHSLAAVTSLPPAFLRLLQKPVCVLVPGTAPGAMPFSVARIADLGMAAAALGKLASVNIAVDVLGLDPLPATPRRTVDAVPGGKLSVLLVPLLFEARVEQPLDVLQRDVVCRAASGRHVLRISYRQSEALLQARVAHAMAASQLCRPVGRQVVLHTNDALDPWNVSLVDRDVGFCRRVI